MVAERRSEQFLTEYHCAPQHSHTHTCRHGVAGDTVATNRDNNTVLRRLVRRLRRRGISDGESWGVIQGKKRSKRFILRRLPSLQSVSFEVDTDDLMQRVLSLLSSLFPEILSAQQLRA